MGDHSGTRRSRQLSAAEPGAELAVLSSPGRVWQATAPAEAILCMNNERQEAAHVIDTRGLVIREAALPPAP